MTIEIQQIHPLVLEFQYRKRYEVTCDVSFRTQRDDVNVGFNTASGMRSHVTRRLKRDIEDIASFQYRKRYEVTCDSNTH